MRERSEDLKLSTTTLTAAEQRAERRKNRLTNWLRDRPAFPRSQPLATALPLDEEPRTEAYVLNPNGYIERYSRQKLYYRLLPNPEKLNLYAYFNALFGLKGEKALTPTSPEQHDTHWEMLSYVLTRLFDREQYLEFRGTPLSAAEQEELRIIDINTKKIGLVLDVIVASPHCDKRLYDVAMGFDNSPEMLEVVRLLGGKAQLLSFMKEHPNFVGSEIIIHLQNVNLLNPENFQQLIGLTDEELSDLHLSINDLVEGNILTQANFNRLIEKKAYISLIQLGLMRLDVVDIVTQEYFDLVVNAGSESKKIGYYLESLKDINMLTVENINNITQRTLKNHIFNPLLEMQENKQLNDQTAKAAHWQGPKEIHELTNQLDKMIAYGLYLLSCDTDKGKMALLHGLHLKQQLKNFFESPQVEHIQQLEQFKVSFLRELHCKDEEMGAHRQAWKILVVNVALALTGIGLLVVGIKYALTGQCFFANTHRQDLVKAVDNNEWLQSIKVESIPNSYLSATI